MKNLSLYHLPYVVRVIKSRRLAGHVTRMKEGRSTFKILTGKPLGYRWEDNIRIDFKEIGFNNMRIRLVWLRIGTIREPL